MEAIRKQATKLREQVAKQQQVHPPSLSLSLSLMRTQSTVALILIDSMVILMCYFDAIVSKISDICY